MAKKQKFPEPTPLLDLAAARLVKRAAATTVEEMKLQLREG